MESTFIAKLYIALIAPLIASVAGAYAAEHIHTTLVVVVPAFLLVVLLSTRLFLKTLQTIALKKKEEARSKYLNADYNRLKLLVMANPAEATMFITTGHLEDKNLLKQQGLLN